jgi:hypothetical protein
MISMGQSFSAVQEKRPVPGGTYNLTIENAEEHVSKESGKPSIKVTIGIEGHDDAPKVLHYASLPAEGDEPEKITNKMLMLKRFLVAFSIPYEDTGFNIEDFFGAKASAPLTLTDPSEDPNGNIYNRLNLPRLADEGVSKSGGGAKKS